MFPEMFPWHVVIFWSIVIIGCSLFAWYETRKTNRKHKL